MRTHRGVQAHTDACGSWSPSLGVWASSAAVARSGAEKSPPVAARAFRVVTVHSRVARAPIALRRGSSSALAPSPHPPAGGPATSAQGPLGSLSWSGARGQGRPRARCLYSPRSHRPGDSLNRGLWFWLHVGAGGGGGVVPSPRTGNGRKLKPAQEGVNF